MAGIFAGIAREANPEVTRISMDGVTVFRLHDGREGFTDYEIRHDDRSVTNDIDAMVAFYSVNERNILDHSLDVLGLWSGIES